jgi:hypothetical protein
MFPPLAVIGCFTVYVRTIYLQHALGRIVHLSKDQPDLIKLVNTLNEECKGISKLLLNSLISLPLLLSVLWSWFLFDIWGDQSGFSPAYAVFIVLPFVPLILLPFIAPAVNKLVLSTFESFFSKSNADEVQPRETLVEMKKVIRMETCNPISQNNVWSV